MIWTLIGAVLLVVAGYLLGALRARSCERALVKTLAERAEELYVARSELKQLASLDSVTGLAGPQYLQEFLEGEWRRALRYGTPLSLIMIDIDHFKTYNERLGREAGDGCLKLVADALSVIVHRPADLVARYGGDKFVVVLGGAGGEGAISVADKLRAAVEALELPHPESATAERVTVSLGVATVVPTRDAQWEEIELIVKAERALLQAKQLGRNRVA